jgi:hypothetical protein
LSRLACSFRQTQEGWGTGHFKRLSEWCRNCQYHGDAFLYVRPFSGDQNVPEPFALHIARPSRSAWLVVIDNFRRILPICGHPNASAPVVALDDWRVVAECRYLLDIIPVFQVDSVLRTGRGLLYLAAQNRRSRTVESHIVGLVVAGGENASGMRCRRRYSASMICGHVIDPSASGRNKHEGGYTISDRIPIYGKRFAITILSLLIMV